jgi:hypothetical protein
MDQTIPFYGSNSNVVFFHFFNIEIFDRRSRVPTSNNKTFLKNLALSKTWPFRLAINKITMYNEQQYNFYNFWHCGELIL